MLSLIVEACCRCKQPIFAVVADEVWCSKRIDCAAEIIFLLSLGCRPLCCVGVWPCPVLFDELAAQKQVGEWVPELFINLVHSENHLHPSRGKRESKKHQPPEQPVPKHSASPFGEELYTPWPKQALWLMTVEPAGEWEVCWRFYTVLHARLCLAVKLNLQKVPPS